MSVKQRNPNDWLNDEDSGPVPMARMRQAPQKPKKRSEDPVSLARRAAFNAKRGEGETPRK